MTYEAPYAAFWIIAAFALVCLVSAVVGLIGWVWFLLAGAAFVGTLHAIHRVYLRRVYEAEADHVMDHVMERLKPSHPNGGVTFDENVAALRAEGVPDVERFTAEYPRPKEKPG